MFAFALPWLFVLLPLPCLCRFLLAPAKQQVSAALQIPFYQALQSLHLGQQQRSILKRKKWLAYLAWFLLVSAAAGPQWIGEPIELERSGRDIMLAIDLSGSMEIRDMELNGQAVDRLEVVKAVARQFISQRRGDRLGLILFGTRAYLQTPLTFDYKTVITMLEDSSIALPGPQTAIGDAIGLAVKHLREVPEESRVLVLLTDGENNAGVLDPLQAAELAAENHVKIYTIGMGANRMLVPGLLGPQEVNPSWDLDEEALAEIANETQ